MARITDEQWKAFASERDDLLNKVALFRSGMLFPERYANQEECPRKMWLVAFEGAVRSTELFKEHKFEGVKLDGCNDIMFGVVLQKYFSRIKEELLHEFGEVILPFDKMLTEYEARVLKILEIM